MSPPPPRYNVQYKLQREIERLNRELSAEKESRKEDRIRLDTELETLRKYANTHDKSHGSDVHNLIETINNEAASFASAIADTWAIKGPKGPDGKYNGSRTYLIPGVVKALEECNPQNPLARRLFQIAIQAYIAKLVNWVLRKTCFGLSDEQDTFMHKLHEMVSISESQPTFARWRAITQTHLQSLALEDREQRVTVLTGKVLQGLQGLGTCLTGYKPTEENLVTLRQEVEISIKEIISYSIQLGGMVSTNIMSSNFDCFEPEGENFDPEVMEMPHAITEGTSDDRVVATVRLGVVKLEKVGREAVEGVQHIRTVELKAHVLTMREITSMVAYSITPPAPKVSGSIPSIDMKPPASKAPESLQSHQDAQGSAPEAPLPIGTVLKPGLVAVPLLPEQPKSGHHQKRSVSVVTSTRPPEHEVLNQHQTIARGANVNAHPPSGSTESLASTPTHPPGLPIPIEKRPTPVDTSKHRTIDNPNRSPPATARLPGNQRQPHSPSAHRTSTKTRDGASRNTARPQATNGSATDEHVFPLQARNPTIPPNLYSAKLKSSSKPEGGSKAVSPTPLRAPLSSIVAPGQKTGHDRLTHGTVGEKSLVPPSLPPSLLQSTTFFRPS